jgi:hypothetical protein
MKKQRDLHKKQIDPFLVLSFLVLSFPLLIGAAIPQRNSPANLQPASSPAGNVARGQQLFMGTLHLQNGGPPCMGCHNIDSNGLLGGGVLGPDLTEVSHRYTEVGLAKVLADFPGPTMRPIFTDHPLTPQEQADLLVFLQFSAGQPISNREPILWGLSLAGLFASAALFRFLYHGRLRSIRGKLIREAQQGTQSK